MPESFEEMFLALLWAGIAVEPVGGFDVDQQPRVGVRLRTFGRKLPPKRMVLATGATFEEALQNAVLKARDGRWETLDWADRPWPTSRDGASASQYGF